MPIDESCHAPDDLTRSRRSRRAVVAPYLKRPSFRRHADYHPARPLIWAAILVLVPLYWLTAVAWFIRVVF